MKEEDKIKGMDESVASFEADEQVPLAEEQMSLDDEQMLQMFFADHQMDIPDDGFSKRVMERLPASSHRRLERWWQVACIVMGIVFIISTQLVSSLQDSLFASKVAGMMLFSKMLCNLGDMLVQPQQLLMLLGGLLTLFCVWGYNKVLDARIGI